MSKNNLPPSLDWKGKAIHTAIENTMSKQRISPEEIRKILKYLLETVYK
jgi:hypothetical protein